MFIFVRPCCSFGVVLLNDFVGIVIGLKANFIKKAIKVQRVAPKAQLGEMVIIPKWACC